jgi:IMP dehydrogenase
MPIHKSELEPLSYDDIILLPNYSEIDSRDKVNLYLKDKTYMPIFSAPMKNISEPNFIIELDKLGGVGILHRFFEKDEDRYNAVDQISYCKNFGVAIGINDFENELKFVEYSIKKGCSFVCIDSASGHHKNTIDAVKKLSEFRNNFVGFYIIVGNVVDSIACNMLIEAGANIIRVGIGMESNA